LAAFMRPGWERQRGPAEEKGEVCGTTSGEKAKGRGTTEPERLLPPGVRSKQERIQEGLIPDWGEKE